MESRPRPRARWASAISRVVSQRRTAAAAAGASPNASPTPRAARAGAAAAALSGAAARRATLRSQILSSQPAARSRHDVLIIDALLQQTGQLAQLSRAVRHALARHARLHTFAAGDVVCRLGEPVDRLVVTISGPVDVVDSSCSVPAGGPAAGAGGAGGGPQQQQQQGRQSGPGGGGAAGGPASPHSPAALRPLCFGAACLRASISGGPPAGPAVYAATAVAAGRVEAMVVPAHRAAAVVEAEAASPDVPAIKAALRAVPCLSWLPDAPLTALAADASLRRYPAGAVIFAQGRDDADAFAFLVAGAVRLLRAMPVPPEALSPRRLRGLLLRAEREEAYAAVLGEGALPPLSVAGPGGQEGRSAGDGANPQGRRGGGGGEVSYTGADTPTAEGGGQQRASPQQQQGLLRPAMRRPAVPPLVLPAPGDPAAAADTPGSSGSCGSAAAGGGGGPLTARPKTAGAASDGGLVPLVHAIKAALRWAARPRQRAAAAAAAAARTPGPGAGGPRSGLVTSRRPSVAPVTPWGAKTPAAARPPLTAGSAAPPSAGSPAGALALARTPGRGSGGQGGKGVRWSAGTSASSDSSPWGGADTPSGGPETSRSAAAATTAAEEAPWPRVMVELGRLAPGQCFGDVREGCAKGVARYSAVADAPCEVLTVPRGAVARALGPRLLPLLFEAGPESRGSGLAAAGGGAGGAPVPPSGASGRGAAGAAQDAPSLGLSFPDAADGDASLRAALFQALARDALKAALAQGRREAAAQRAVIHA